MLVRSPWLPSTGSAAAVGTAGAVVGGAARRGVVVRIALRRLGGITGDVLGATAEIATAAALVILVAVPPEPASDVP